MKKLEKEGQTIENLGLANYVQKINASKESEDGCVSKFFHEEKLASNSGVLLHNWDLGLSKTRTIRWKGIEEKCGTKKLRMVKVFKTGAKNSISGENYTKCIFV